MAVMYSSACPDVTSPEVFCAHFAEGSPEQRVFEEQSSRDWETFLLCRAKELVPGGRLVIESGGRGTCPCTGTTSDIWCLFGSMSDIWRDMMREQLITEDEFLTTLAPWYFRTEEDLAAPFEDTHSPVRNSGLRLLAMETHNIKCSWRERWTKLNKQGEITGTFQWLWHFERNSDEKAKLLDEIFERLVDQVAIAPADRGHHRVDQFVTIAKTCEV
ncbi:hypothetical protein NP493_2734g00002 [Ridgeia piscesae]|uniref:Uncharacterized protein n=1 Tax=Ridgeia piscesae TaxID=27915 RepID=A0AAD9JDB6_RIDPI|nr:hypothetical protein NP493_2734g00002 [Ridgeia piscesae]